MWWAIGYFIFSFIVLALFYNEWQTEKDELQKALEKIKGLEKEIRVMEELTKISIDKAEDMEF